ncbi:hypothetical protein F751_3031 [Auxenochlorella protothecoides]|uniref:Uncharacterized protein n=1 Tax=Auxenochlorella protothecoides TaxID=3075 RepID=A0A087SF09_AUXPR|nr:hypothetical protein F751_3031 [Auxenochlorella protothecoides]KFM24313.1 hypothetical protein F751_3031 [Auxenochlorella protothecoides]
MFSLQGGQRGIGVWGGECRLSDLKGAASMRLHALRWLPALVLLSSNPPSPPGRPWPWLPPGPRPWLPQSGPRWALRSPPRPDSGCAAALPLALAPAAEAAAGGPWPGVGRGRVRGGYMTSKRAACGSVAGLAVQSGGSPP